MMGGMGEEEVYQLKLDIPATTKKIAVVEEEEEFPEEQVIVSAKAAFVADAEEDAEAEAQEEVDFSDPFAMMGGMGEEEVYQLKLDIPATTKKIAVVEEEEEFPEEQVIVSAKAAFVADAEEDAEAEAQEEVDFSDPFAMMGGMGEEEVYQLKLDIPATTKKIAVVEEEEEFPEEQVIVSAKAAFVADAEED
ncbi:unnamed protein product [Polarella glacialis]|uniref:Uncharacterized protein n=1 Tax=Polarella glacialis TaxID=89957 RepID=A0A813FQ07_POLGL|nr:unnamed protein product [Polarella glacialis]